MLKFSLLRARGIVLAPVIASTGGVFVENGNLPPMESRTGVVLKVQASTAHRDEYELLFER